MPDRPHRLIRVLGVGASLTLAVSAQAGPEDAEKPDAGPPPIIHRNPPAPAPPPPPPEKLLPSWDDVGSGHPPRATNPPRPVFEVTADGTRCFKAWEGSMRPPDAEVAAHGGRVLDRADQARGTEIRCDEARVQAVLDAKRAAEAED